MRKLFYNGEILTMESPRPAQAMLCEGGRILAVGDLSAIAPMAGRHVRAVDLGGGTLIPSFVDCGSNFLCVAASELAAMGGHGSGARREAVRRAAERYLAAGITVLHGRGADGETFRRLAHSDMSLPLYLDVDIRDFEGAYRAAASARGTVRPGAVTLELDVREDGGQPSGLLSYCDRALGHALHMAAAAGVPLSVGAESEGAAAQFLRVARAMSRACPALPATRPRMMDARLLSPLQMEQVRAVGAVPCFAADAISREGDDLLAAWGLEAAGRLTPYASAREAGVPYVLISARSGQVPDMWGLVCDAVSRRTARGVRLGERERAGVYDAIRAVTAHGAWCYHAEHRYGTLRAGLAANMILLEENPLTVPTASLPHIRRMAVFFEGEEVWRAERTYVAEREIAGVK